MLHDRRVAERQGRVTAHRQRLMMSLPDHIGGTYASVGGEREGVGVAREAERVNENQKGREYARTPATHISRAAYSRA